MIELVPFQPGDEIAVHQLVMNVFDRFVAPEYSEEGYRTFADFVAPERIGERIADGTDYMLLALDDDKLVGMISVRNADHISLLFVDSLFHGRGIAKRLYRQALENLQPALGGKTKITVNSSPYAVKIYEKLGFKAVDSMREQNGIKFVPMEACPDWHSS